MVELNDRVFVYKPSGCGFEHFNAIFCMAPCNSKTNLPAKNQNLERGPEF